VIAHPGLIASPRWTFMPTYSKVFINYLAFIRPTSSEPYRAVADAISQLKEIPNSMLFPAETLMRCVEMDEKQMITKAKHYLKNQYGEDTISMDVTDNSVGETGNGIFSVDCTVSVGRTIQLEQKVSF
jgi:hypothetical protein